MRSMRTQVIALLLFALAVMPVKAVTSSDYARAQTDAVTAFLNFSDNLLRVLASQLTNNSRSLAFISVNSTMIQSGTLEQREILARQIAGLPNAVTNISNATQNIGANAAYIWGDTGKGNLSIQRKSYIITSKAATIADSASRFVEDFATVYVEWQRWITQILV